MGQANRKRGRVNEARPWPLENQITISLSLYMRDKVETTEMKRLRLMMVVIWFNTVKPMTNITSDGLTLPRLAWPSVRIRTTVITIVIKITSVAPKLRARSLRKVEWNNIGEKEKLNYELRNPKTRFVTGHS